LLFTRKNWVGTGTSGFSAQKLAMELATKFFSFMWCTHSCKNTTFGKFLGVSEA